MVDSPGVEPSRYVIFDLDGTLVHSEAVREAFAIAADAYGIRPRVLLRAPDALAGRRAGRR